MDKSIYKLQNAPHLLKCLVAQRNEYSKAKKAISVKLLITVGLVTAFSVLTSVMVSDVLSTISIFLAFALLFVNKKFDAFVSTRKEVAANIQQHFDVSLYSSVLAQDTTEWGEKLTETDIAEAISGINEEQLKPFENWYSDYSLKLPISQIFCCQKENIRWDSRLRNKYRKLNITLCIAAIFILVGLAIAFNPTFLKCIAVLAWCLPTIDYFYEIICGLNKDNKRIERLKETCDSIERKMNNLKSDEESLIKLQQGIYEHRKNAVLVPNWFYWVERDSQQKDEEGIARNVCVVEQEEQKHD